MGSGVHQWKRAILSAVKDHQRRRKSNLLKLNKMKKLLKYITLPIVSGIFLTGCKQEFLDTKPLDKASSVDTWKDPALSEAFVTGLYSGLGQGGFDEQMLASLTDEAVFTHPSRGINVINEAVLNPSNLGWVNVNYRWGKDGSKKRYVWKDQARQPGA